MLLLHPKVTLSAAIAGCAAVGAAFGSVAVALAPVGSVPQLGFIAAHVLPIAGYCSAISVVCIAIAGVGRSFMPYVDNGGGPPGDPAPASVIELPKAA
jgi:hypothetical protein